MNECIIKSGIASFLILSINDIIFGRSIKFCLEQKKNKVNIMIGRQFIIPFFVTLFQLAIFNLFGPLSISLKNFVICTNFGGTIIINRIWIHYFPK
jgi:hypothetical protein